MGDYDDETASKPDSVFRKAFKMFRTTSPDQCADLIDFNKPDNYGGLIRRLSIDDLANDEKADFDSLYLRWPPNEWNAFEVEEKPGFIFLKNPFIEDGHYSWAERCLIDYARWPHGTNIDGILEKDGLALKDLSIFNDQKLLKKLRWATMGYHHNWNTKIYDEEKRSDVPNDLHHLSRIVAKSLFGQETNFSPEAVIVNFYRMNSTLAGHVDHSERNFESPLFSFSFGQSAIFMLGGKTLDDTPIAVKIRSGDVVVMSGECRLAYHGVPRIFKEPDFAIMDGKIGDQESILKYLNENRINMNVRQVN